MAAKVPIVMVAKGTLPFPVDMLRYDQCWPNDSQSAAEIGASFDIHERFAQGREGKFTVELTNGNGKNRRWTPDRWRSFGWALEVPS